jgi:hypothetical protein
VACRKVRVKVVGLEFLLLDDCLGLHLPVIKVSLGELNFSQANVSVKTLWG